MTGPKPMDLAGQTFGALTALEPARRGTVRGWACRCDCGAMTWAATARLTTGHKRSCGCQRMRGAERTRAGECG